MSQCKVEKQFTYSVQIIVAVFFVFFASSNITYADSRQVGHEHCYDANDTVLTDVFNTGDNRGGCIAEGINSNGAYHPMSRADGSAVPDGIPIDEAIAQSGNSGSTDTGTDTSGDDGSSAEDEGAGSDDGSVDDGTTADDGDPTSAQNAPIAFTNPIAFNTVDGLLGRILITIQSIVAILAILFIVIGAIIYITSGGNQQRTELAKNAIFAALIGLALALAAPSFLKEIYTAVGGDITNNEVDNARTLTEIALSITRFLLSLVGVLSIVMLVSGGIIYILSAGDQSRTDTAKRTIIYAIIGLVVALVSLVIVGQVVGVIG